MSKILSILFLTFSVVTTAFISPVQTEAQNYTSGVVIVTAKAGLNVRDANCNRLDTIPFGTTLLTDPAGAFINCTINGVKHTLTYIYGPQGVTQGYVSTSFIKAVYANPNIDSQVTTRVTATAGLNVRDENCKKIGLMAFNQVVQVRPSDDFITCEVGGSFYQLVPIYHNGKHAYAASTFMESK
jgi:hypothetical protein